MNDYWLYVSNCQHEAPSPMDSPGKLCQVISTSCPFNPLFQKWQWFGNSTMHHHLPGLSVVQFHTVSYRPVLNAVNLNESVILMCRHRYVQCKIVSILEQQIALWVNRSYVVYHNREQYGPEDSTLQYPSVNASKFSDKAVHDYSLSPITKKADNPIDNIRINISRVTLAFCRQYSMWNTVKSFTEVKEKTLTKSVVLSNHFSQ